MNINMLLLGMLAMSGGGPPMPHRSARWPGGWGRPRSRTYHAKRPHSPEDLEAVERAAAKRERKAAKRRGGDL